MRDCNRDIKNRAIKRVLSLILIMVLIAGLTSMHRVNVRAASTEAEIGRDVPIREVHKVKVGDSKYCVFVQHNVILTPAEVKKMSDRKLTEEILKRAGFYLKETNCREFDHKIIMAGKWIRDGGSFKLSDEDIEAIRSAKPASGAPVKLHMDVGISEEPAPKKVKKPSHKNSKDDTSKKDDSKDNKGDKDKEDDNKKDELTDDGQEDPGAADDGTTDTPGEVKDGDGSGAEGDSASSEEGTTQDDGEAGDTAVDDGQSSDPGDAAEDGESTDPGDAAEGDDSGTEPGDTADDGEGGEDPGDAADDGEGNEGEDPGDAIDDGEGDEDPGDAEDDEPGIIDNRKIYSTYKINSPEILFVVIATAKDAAKAEDVCEEPEDEDGGHDGMPEPDDISEPEDILPEFRTISMEDRSGGPLEETLKDGNPVELEWREPSRIPDNEDGSGIVERIPGGKAGLTGIIVILAGALIAGIAAYRKRRDDD